MYRCASHHHCQWLHPVISAPPRTVEPIEQVQNRTRCFVSLRCCSVWPRCSGHISEQSLSYMGRLEYHSASYNRESMFFNESTTPSITCTDLSSRRQLFQSHVLVSHPNIGHSNARHFRHNPFWSMFCRLQSHSFWYSPCLSYIHSPLHSCYTLQVSHPNMFYVVDGLCVKWEPIGHSGTGHFRCNPFWYSPWSAIVVCSHICSFWYSPCWKCVHLPCTQLIYSTRTFVVSTWTDHVWREISHWPLTSATLPL
jgi:hypothetical protein